jgi:hypothetical protein
MAQSLNDLNITARNGLYVYMPNTPQPHNCIVSASETSALKAGDIVKLDITSTNTAAPVIKKAAVTDPVFGVVVFDAMKTQYAALDKISVAIEGSYIHKTTAGVVTPGAVLYFNAAGAVTATATAGNSTIGTANTYAASGDLVQVKLKFATTEEEEVSGTT